MIDGTAGTVLTRYAGRRRDDGLPALRHLQPRRTTLAMPGPTCSSSASAAGATSCPRSSSAQTSVTGVEINGEHPRRRERRATATSPAPRPGPPRAPSSTTRPAASSPAPTKRYDLIQISLIDTWAATAAGAFALTRELALHDRGVGDVLRPARAGRHALACHAGDSVARHDRAARGATAPSRWPPQALKNRRSRRTRATTSSSTTGRRPPTARAPRRSSSAPSRSQPRAVATLAEVAERLGFAPVLTPDGRATRCFAGARRAGRPRRRRSPQFDEDVSPPTDDRPFFFQMADLGTFLSAARASRDDLVSRARCSCWARSRSRCCALAAVCIGVPAAGPHRPASRHAGMAPFYLYFAGDRPRLPAASRSRSSSASTSSSAIRRTRSRSCCSRCSCSAGIGSMLSERLVDAPSGRARCSRRSAVLLAVVVGCSASSRRP